MHVIRVDWSIKSEIGYLIQQKTSATKPSQSWTGQECPANHRQAQNAQPIMRSTKPKQIWSGLECPANHEPIYKTQPITSKSTEDLSLLRAYDPLGDEMQQKYK